MERHTFSSYEEYVDAQVRLTRKKLRKENHTIFTSPKAVKAIDLHFRQFTGSFVEYGLCHGVRRGEEVRLFEKEHGGEWIGSEITPELCDGQRLICQGFSLPRPEWTGKFDAIYSNSFDHSNDPPATAQVWVSQLKENGCLYVEWTPWHNKLGRHWKADCFAASESEYRRLFDSVAIVTDIIEVEDLNFTRKIFVVVK